MVGGGGLAADASPSPPVSRRVKGGGGWWGRSWVLIFFFFFGQSQCIEGWSQHGALCGGCFISVFALMAAKTKIKKIAGGKHLE